MDDRLYRSRDDRVFAGVAGGLAERLDADPSIIRIVWAVLIFVTGGLALLVYIVMAVVVPVGPPEGRAQTFGGSSGTPPPSGPVAPGSWVAPDGSSVPLAASSAPRPRRQHDPADRTRAGLIAGLVLIGLGGLFLARELMPAFDFDLWWPTLAIGLGVVLVVLALVPSRRSG